MNRVCVDKRGVEEMLKALYKYEEKKFDAGLSDGGSCDTLRLVLQFLEMMED